MHDENQMNTARIEQALRDAAKTAQIHVFPSLASTNTTAKQMAAEGAPNGLVVIAEHQSAGRGRMQRSFFSPDGTGLYMSLVVRRALSPSLATRLTTAAAVATAQAIEAMSGRTAQIKWVNDVYLDGKKVSGILCEAALSQTGREMDYAVIGIGVNVAPPPEGFPPEIADIATAMLPEAQDGAHTRERLAADILNRLMPMLDDLGSPAILADYQQRSFLSGQRVLVRRMEEQGREAQVLGLDEEFRLLVRYADGSTEALDSGEVSVKRK